MGLSGLTPVGLAFVIIVLLVMLLGIGAAIWHSWIAPIRRRMQLTRTAPQGQPHQEDDEDIEKADPATSTDPSELDTPDLESSTEITFGSLGHSPTFIHEAVTPHNTPYLGSTEHSSTTLVEHLSPSLSMLTKREGQSGGLPLPPAVHTVERKVRFSVSNADGSFREAVWWFF